jgi:hypothetical protein
MAIRRQRAYVNALDQLLGDLPQLLLNMQTNVERSKIERERIASEERRSVAEISLQNLSFTMERRAKETAIKQEQIATMEEDRANVTTYLPPAGSLNATSDFNAAEVLEDVTAGYTGPLQAGIEERVNIASDIFQEGAEVDAEWEAADKREKAMRRLQGKYKQNLGNIAKYGSISTLVESGDMEQYYDDVIAPEFAGTGRYTPSEISEYRDMWSGMFAPIDQRLKEQITLQQQEEAQVSELLTASTLNLTLFRGMSYEQQDQAIARATKDISDIVKPALTNANVGRQGALINKYVEVTNAQRAMAEDPTYESKNYYVQVSQELKNMYIDVGYTITGQGKKATGDVAQREREAAKTKAGKLPAVLQNMDDANAVIGESYVKSILAAIDKDMPSLQPLMDMYKIIGDSLNFQAYVDKETGEVRYKTDKGRRVDEQTWHELSELTGYSVNLLKAGVLDKLKEMHENKNLLKTGRLFGAFETPGTPVKDTMVGSIESDTFRPYHLESPTIEDERYLNMAVGEIIQSEVNDWIV